MLKLKCYLPLLAIMACQSFDSKEKLKNQVSFLGKELKSQEAQLVSREVSVCKVTKFSGKIDTAIIKNIDWSKEMALFSVLDIFKPVYKGNFNVENKVDRAHQVSKYSKISKSKSPIDSLLIYKNRQGKMSHILAFGSTRNFFFAATSRYSLDFDTVSGRLRNYELDAKKTFIWGKSDTYAMYSRILE